MTQAKRRYLLNIEAIPEANKTDLSPASSPLRAYFVGSTAPNNVEDGVSRVPNPEIMIQEIAQFLKQQEHPELLIAVHGYNTGLGNFANAGDKPQPGVGVKGWYQDIRNHIAEHYPDRTNGLVLIGYRWPSEQVKGSGNDSLKHKLWYAHQSLPTALKVISALSIATLAGLSIVSVTTDLPGSVTFGVVGVSLLILAIILISIVFTLFILKIAGYFRDAYRANNFGVPDLVELIRQLDKAIVGNSPPEISSDNSPPNRANLPIKLSFIGHSMGGFVVTNTVRILSDVFDKDSIGHVSLGNTAKCPSPKIGNVFSLGRLVLVSPDIPAETIISGRANFLSSSLRRFEETYLFSNEGDMALKLASTAANYSSFPTRTSEGGYRLGNVVVRSPLPGEEKSGISKAARYGIINLDPDQGCLINVQTRAGNQGVEPVRAEITKTDGLGNSEVIKASSFLKYLYILDSTSLADRQKDILDAEQKPIAELFTVFDCTDYQEEVPGDSNTPSQKVGVLSHALGKQSLNFWDYVRLTFDFFTGKIDTHGGYFYSSTAVSVTAEQKPRIKPDAQLSKHLIYGLACLGFQNLLLDAKENTVENRKSALQAFSKECEQHSIQVLLATERYNRDILGLEIEGDRDGY